MRLPRFKPDRMAFAFEVRRDGGGKPQPWDAARLGKSAALSQTDRTNPQPLTLSSLRVRQTAVKV